MKEHAKIAHNENGFFAPHFSGEERARLAALDDPYNLDDEIGLLKVLIRRQLTRPPTDRLRDGGAILQVDVKKTCRYLDTLCRAIKIAHFVRHNPRDGMSDELKRILLEINAEAEEEDEPFLIPALSPPGSPRGPVPNRDRCSVRR